MPASRVRYRETFADAFARAVAEPGPHLIEAVVPTTLSARQLRAMPHALRALGVLPRPLAAAVKRRLYP